MSTSAAATGGFSLSRAFKETVKFAIAHGTVLAGAVFLGVNLEGAVAATLDLH